MNFMSFKQSLFGASVRFHNFTIKFVPKLNCINFCKNFLNFYIKIKKERKKKGTLF